MVVGIGAPVVGMLMLLIGGVSGYAALGERVDGSAKDIQELKRDLERLEDRFYDRSTELPADLA